MLRFFHYNMQFVNISHTTLIAVPTKLFFNRLSGNKSVFPQQTCTKNIKKPNTVFRVVNLSYSLGFVSVLSKSEIMI